MHEAQEKKNDIAVGSRVALSKAAICRMASASAFGSGSRRALEVSSEPPRAQRADDDSVQTVRSTP